MQFDWRYVAAGLVLVTAAMLAQQVTIPQHGATGEAVLTVDYPARNTTATVPLRNGSTAFAVLNRTAPVTVERYSFGLFVTGIGGVAQNDTHSWIYLVNGTPAQRAADRVVLADGATVTYRFMDRNASAALFD